MIVVANLIDLARLSCKYEVSFLKHLSVVLASEKLMSRLETLNQIAFSVCNSTLVLLLEGLCSSNPCRLEFSVF